MKNNSLKANIKNILTSKKGFSLVEIIVVIALIILIFGIVYNFFDFSSVMSRKTDDTASKQQQARIILMGLRKDIGTALEVLLVPEGTYSLEPGKYTIYVEKNNPSMKGRLAKRDSSGNVEYIYTSIGYPTMQLDLKVIDPVNDPSMLHMKIIIDGKVMAETDIYCLNTTVQYPPGDPTGKTLIYKPSE